MALHGCCISPPGYRAFHEHCPGSWGGQFGIEYRCSCECHDDETED